MLCEKAIVFNHEAGESKKFGENKFYIRIPFFLLPREIASLP